MRTLQPVTDHHLARLTLWALSILVWAAGVLFGDVRAKRRHIRQRYSALSIGKLNAHGAQSAADPRRPLPMRTFEVAALAHLHAAFTAAKRRLMKRGSLGQRLTRLIQIVRNLDAYARRFALRRARHGLTRLLAIRMTHPSQHVLNGMCARGPRCRLTAPKHASSFWCNQHVAAPAQRRQTRCQKSR